MMLLKNKNETVIHYNKGATRMARIRVAAVASLLLLLFGSRASGYLEWSDALVDPNAPVGPACHVTHLGWIGEDGSFRDDNDEIVQYHVWTLTIENRISWAVMKGR